MKLFKNMRSDHLLNSFQRESWMLREYLSILVDQILNKTLWNIISEF